MKRLMIAVFCLVLTLSLSGLPAEPSDEIDLASLKASEACQAAEREPDFGDLIEISAPIKNLIIEYKMGWRRLCGGEWEGTIYPLYQQAKAIEKSFSSVFEETEGIVRAIGKREGSDAAYEKANKVHDMLWKRYPSFVPLFIGSYMDRSFFKVYLKGLRKYAPLGDAEDSLFFKAFFELRGDTLFDPWIEGTWDYGGCYRFGEYQWVDVLNNIDLLKKKLTRPLYRESILGFEKDLKNFFKDLGMRAEHGWPVCTCRSKEAVLKDLRVILEKIKDRPEYEETALTLGKVLNAIERNEVDILSEAEKHCSGG